MQFSSILQKKITYWSQDSCFDSLTKGEILSLLEEKNEKELIERFHKDLEFGTGGLRGILGAGSNRMNIYNVRRASESLARYLKRVHGNLNNKSVALSFDSRQFSEVFAKASAEVFAAHGLKSYITKDMRPVPMLSFLVRLKQCLAGVCVTASHNPPEYNGYKVYWNTGAQIIPPHDKEIIKIYESIENFGDIKHLAFEEAQKKGLIQIMEKEFDEIYFAKVKELTLTPDLKKNLKIVYSPLHGSGLYPVTTMLDRYGFKDVHVVKEQEDPAGGKFPTVKFPNPEDPEALTLAIELGKKIDADIVMATDPDCDRLGFLVKENGEFKLFNGNQIICLLTEFVLSQKKARQNLPKESLVIKTIVTTELMAEIAKGYGARLEDTLTGFKWICSKAEDLETKEGLKFICGGEESYGFLCGSFVRDKDAVISSVIACEMLNYYKSIGKTLSSVLDELFMKFGVYQETLLTITLPGKDGLEKMLAMMSLIRNSPPTSIAGSRVVKILDYENSIEKNLVTQSQNPILDLPQSNVLQFILENNSRVSVRPSGTEPKIKFYVSACQLIKGLKGENLEKAKITCQRLAKDIEQEFVSRAKAC